MNTRHFYRCTDCLTVVAVEAELAKAECGACGGRMESMGRVDGLRLTELRTGAVCDGRCTHANGPRCDCQCGGANHGSGRTVTYSIDRGPVPQVDVPAKCDALRIANEWREALERGLAECRGISDRKHRGEYLPESEFRRMLSLSYRINKARKLRTHNARMRALGDIVAEKAVASC